MRQTTGTRKSPGEKIVKDIKRATRKHYSSEEKIRIVLDGLRGKHGCCYGQCCKCSFHLRVIPRYRMAHASCGVNLAADRELFGWST